MEQRRSEHGSPSRQPSQSEAVGADPTAGSGAGGSGEEAAAIRVTAVSVAGVHPALAEPPPCIADRHWAAARVLFAVAAAMALGFGAWGFAPPTGLGTVSGSILGWITGNLGWLFVLLASAFVVFVIWLAAGKDGRVPGGGGRGAP